MASLDSKVRFRVSAAELGVGDAVKAVLVASERSTFSSFAFACNYSPGQADDAEFLAMAAIVCEVSPAPPNWLPVIRRWFFESWTSNAADLKRTFEHVEDSEKPRKMATPEWHERYLALAELLAPGLKLVSELEPAHVLVDTCVKLREDDFCQYIPLHACTRRLAEREGIKVDLMWRPDASGSVKQVSQSSHGQARLSTDLLMRYAFQRRALLLEMAYLMAFVVMEAWTEVLLVPYSRDAVPGYEPVSFCQLVTADRHLFKLVADSTRAGIRRDPAGALPMNAKIGRHMVSSRVMFFLQPQPGSSGGLPVYKRSTTQAAADKPLPKTRGAKSSAARARARALKEAQLARLREHVHAKLRSPEPARAEPASLLCIDRGSVRELAAAEPALGVAAQPSSNDGGASNSEKQSPASRIQSPLALEIFEGGAKITAELRAVGLDGLGVDYKRNRSRPEAPCLGLDLTSEQGRQVHWRILDSGRVALVWTAPPRGTANRASERRIPSHLRKQGVFDPKPLRTGRQPGGVGDLKGFDRARVLAAYLLDAFTSEHSLKAHRMGALVVVENPRNSLFSTLRDSSGISSVDFDSCMHGSQRPGRQHLWTNLGKIESPAADCEEASPTHRHLPWSASGSRGTTWSNDANGAAYPRQFCRRVAAAVSRRLRADGVLLRPEAPESNVATGMAAEQAAKAAAWKLRRGQKSSSPLSEFGSVVTRTFLRNQLTSLLDPLLTVKKTGLQSPPVPKGSRLIEVLPGLFTASGVVSEAGDERMVDARLGIFSAFDISAKGKLDTLKFRIGQLMEEERALHSRLSPDVAAVMSRRKLLLLKRMLKDAGYKDSALVDDMASGFRVAGWLTEVEEFGPASFSEESVLLTATWARRALQGSGAAQAARARDSELLDEVRRITANEVGNGLGWNATLTATFKGDLGGIDEFVGLVNAVLRCVDEYRGIRLELTDGSVLRGALHTERTLSEARRLWGRTLDLERAYRQLARHPDDPDVCLFAVWNLASRSDEFYEAMALPLGATGSAYAFNRAARVLRRILVVLFRLMLTNFFDDHPQFEFEALARSARTTAELFLAVLGWRISMRPEKQLPFTATIQPLGVVVDLSSSADLSSSVQRKVVVTYKPSRLESFRASVQDILRDGLLDPSTAASLRGTFILSCARALAAWVSSLTAHLADMLNGAAVPGPSTRRWRSHSVGCWTYSSTASLAQSWLWRASRPSTFSPTGHARATLSRW